jgi:hypothetical protein
VTSSFLEFDGPNLFSAPAPMSGAIVDVAWVNGAEISLDLERFVAPKLCFDQVWVPARPYVS